MLHKTKSRSTGLWKYGFSAPLFILMLIVSAAAASSESNLLSVDGERTIKPIEHIASMPFPEIITGKAVKASKENKISNSDKGIADPTGIEKKSSLPAKPANTSDEENSASQEESSIQDRMPSFPGGMKAWQEYITSTLKYPALAKSNNVQGNVIVKFTVEKDGSLGDIKVLRGIGSGADEEAVRVITSSPKWIPGTIDGEPARVSFTVPINFGGSPIQMGAGREVQDGVFDFSNTEVLPEFEGGMAGWANYLSDNLKYTEVARKNNLQGRVIVGFIVEKDGSLSDIKILRGIGGGLDEEAVRVLKNSPNWKPGKILDGNVVRVAYTMPIFFKLGDK